MSEAQTGVEQALALLRDCDPTAAISTCRAVLTRDATCPPALIVLACALLAGGAEWTAALCAADAALAFAPSAAPAHFVRGTALHALGRPTEAATALHRAVTLAPDDAGAWLNLGNALATLDRMGDAEAALARACTLDPDSAIALASLGTVLVQSLRLPEAVAAYRGALSLRPDFAAVRWDLGFAHLLGGEFSDGWEALRQRKPEENAAVAAWGVAGPEWDGAALQGRRLLVCSSQGLGDAIQFARYLPILARSGAQLAVVCDIRLARLLRRLAGVSSVTVHGEALPEHDSWVALSSLPRLFSTEAHSVPAASGYLSADPQAAATWRAVLGGEAPSVGLVWAGNPAHGNDARRSMPPAALAPVRAVQGARFVSLQPSGTALPGVADLGPRLSDLAETAAAITALDLVITVDTAVAHLAGALGRPVWVALPYAPDWRWQLHRTDSPWYSSVRLFRQPHPGDWASVAADLASALHGRVSSGTSYLGS